MSTVQRDESLSHEEEANKKRRVNPRVKKGPLTDLDWHTYTATEQKGAKPVNRKQMSAKSVNLQGII